MEWLGDLIDWIGNFFQSLILTLWDMVTDVFYKLIELTLDIVGFLVDGVFSTITFNPATYISALPADVTNIIGLVGIGECFTIIVAAVLVRLLLQVIPFTRLGS